MQIRLNAVPQYNVLNNLGIFYKRQARYAEAEHYYRAALRGREACHGAAHESTLHTVGNMATKKAADHTLYHLAWVTGLCASECFG